MADPSGVRGAAADPLREAARRPLVLVVDDDRRVIELLEIALDTHGYRVAAAHDGDEALRAVRRERPDLVVLDVRLPKRSGLEVCEALRRDPDDPNLPVLMVSAMAEVDARVQGLARGADDYLVKPFSPRELVARIQRLIARAGEARAARRMGVEAEIELRRTRDEVQRGQRALRLARDLRADTANLSARLAVHCDPDRLVDDYLSQVMARFDVERVWLAPPGPAHAGCARGRGLPPVLDPRALPERGGELCRFLAALGRAARTEDLLRLPELRAEAGALLAAGLVLALPAGEGAEAGLLAVSDRSDGAPPSAEDRDLLAAWNGAFAARFAASREALARAESWLALMAEWSERNLDARAARIRAAAADAAEAAAGALGFDARESWLVRGAARLLPLTDAAAVADTLGRAASREAAGRLAALAALAAVAADARGVDDAGAPPGRLAILRAACAWAAARTSGRDAGATIERACDEAGADAETREAIRGAFARAGSPPRAAA